MSKLKALLASTIGMAMLAESMSNDLVYSDSPPKRKQTQNHLTNKQLKARAKSKRAKKARRKNH